MTRRTVVIEDAHQATAPTNNNVRIVEGGCLVQYGQLNGDATVESGGVLEQYGQVNGDIYAHGSVTLFGQVNGDVHAFPGSNVLIAEGVMLNSRHSPRYVAPDGTFRPLATGEIFTTQVGSKMWRLNPDGQLSSA